MKLTKQELAIIRYLRKEPSTEIRCIAGALDCAYADQEFTSLLSALAKQKETFPAKGKQ